MTRRPHDAPATSAAYVVYAATIAGLGVIGLVTGGFPSIWAPVPAAVPAHTALAYVTALIMVATGAGLLVPRLASRASRVLLAFVVAWLVLVRLPHMLLAWGVNTWWAACKSAVMASAAWAAARRAEPDASGVG
ncbi:MAG TPA: hypothetical protein VG916_10155, partial [Gemmatimonadaceae bacterium]|nr:hypothetical protein [Gemmatimonadaceae bacterium]